jgi:hypothetical protein
MRFLIAGGLVILGGAILLTGANAGLAGHNGRIAYVHLAGDGRHIQIWTITPAGAHPRQLTSSRNYRSFDPSYSPKGQADRLRPHVQVPAVRPLDDERRRQPQTASDVYRRRRDAARRGPEREGDRYDKATQITHIFVVPAAGGTPTELISDTTDPGISD